jgi:hypothetical protein
MTDNILPPKRRLRKRAMAHMLSLSVRTLDKLMARRIVPFEKVGALILFDPEAVIAAFKKYERKAAK